MPGHQPRDCVQYTAAMPIDVAAHVVTNRALSTDYNVLALAAPEIAAAAAPGQFVMIKAGRGHDPLLRRPFSIFEVLRDERGTPTGISILNKRIGVSTGLVYARADRDSASTASVRSDDRSRSSSRRARAGWWPAASASRRLPSWPRPFADEVSPRCCSTALAAAPSSSISISSADLGVRARLDDRGRQPRRTRTRRGAARSPPRGTTRRFAGHGVRVRPGRHARRHRQNRRATRPAVPGLGRTHHGVRSRRLLQLCRARCEPTTADFITSALLRTVLPRTRCLGRRSEFCGDSTQPRLHRSGDGPFRSHRFADPEEPADCGQRMLWLRRRVRRRVRHLDPGRSSPPRDSFSRSAKDTRRRGSSKRLPGMLNAIGLQGIGASRFVEEKLPELARPGRDRHRQRLRHHDRRVRGGLAHRLRRGRCRGHRAEHLVPEYQGRRHSVRLQPGGHLRGGRRRAQGDAPADHSQADAQRHRRRLVRARGRRRRRRRRLAREHVPGHGHRRGNAPAEDLQRRRRPERAGDQADCRAHGARVPRRW